jgi:hypothetical protein
MSTQKTRTVLLVSWRDVKSLSHKDGDGCVAECIKRQASGCAIGKKTHRLNGAVRTGLGRTDDVEFLHSRLKRGPLHAKFGGGALGATDDPMGGLQRPHDMRSLG